MQIRYIYNSKFAKLLNVEAITIYPFVFIRIPKEKVTEELLNHENEHIAQVKRIGWIRFYISYLMFYWAARIAGYSHNWSYNNIPFEEEGVDMEDGVRDGH